MPFADLLLASWSMFPTLMAELEDVSGILRPAHGLNPARAALIARPFTGTPGNFRRTERRHDYAVEPPRPMLLDVLSERKVPIFGVGKIHDIYNGRGVGDYETTKDNDDGMAKLTESSSRQSRGLIFATLSISTC